MTIYLDYIFIENLLIDYILLKETACISRKETSNKRELIAALISAVYVVIMMYLKIQELNYALNKLLLVIVMIYISFKPKKINEYVKLVILFLLVSTINVGVITVITNLLNIQKLTGIIKIVIYILSFLISSFFTKHMWRIYKQNIRQNDLIYEVNLKLNDKKYVYNGFLDTGNTVYSYTYDLPVIFAELLDKEMLELLNDKEYFYITTVTLSNECQKKAYIFDNVEVKQNNNKWMVKVAIVFENSKISKDNSYNMLLNYNLYTQSLGGIKI